MNPIENLIILYREKIQISLLLSTLIYPVPFNQLHTWLTWINLV
ncbi:MAG: hypothetical protein ACSHWU_12540 [Marinicella sp.]